MQNIGSFQPPYLPGTVYSVEYIDQIRKELEENVKCPLLIKSFKAQRDIVCCISQCPFRMRFVRQINYEGEEGYQLTSVDLNHRGLCVQQYNQYLYEQKIQFITDHRTLINNLVLNTRQKRETQPSRILVRMAETLEISPSFLVDNLNDSNLRRMIKKKFDNIVGEVRRTLNGKQSTETKSHRQRLGKIKDDQSSSYVAEQELSVTYRPVKKAYKLRLRK